MATTMQVRAAGKAAGKIDKEAGMPYGTTKNPYNFVTQNNSYQWWKNGYKAGYNGE